jgi:hypothetical protein
MVLQVKTVVLAAEDSDNQDDVMSRWSKHLFLIMAVAAQNQDTMTWYLEMRVTDVTVTAMMTMLLLTKESVFTCLSCVCGRDDH